jgi:cytochrome c5
VGEEGAAALAEAQPAPAEAATESSAEEIDGSQVYNSLCMTCHDAGVAGAPIKGSEQLAQRASEKGLDTLVTNAINGINVMPPKGGNLSLTDEQIRAAVEFMLN